MVKNDIPDMGEDRMNRHFWEPEFWSGYRRGLNRLRFGKIFGSDEEHRSWLEIPEKLEEEPRIELVAWGIGYRAGFAGLEVEKAAGKIMEFMKTLGDEYGYDEKVT